MENKEFMVFMNGKWPVFNDVKDAVVFYVVNAGFILNNLDLKEKINDYVIRNKKDLEFHPEKSEELYKKIESLQPLKDLKIGSTGNEANKYLRILEKLGAITRHININEEKEIKEEDFDIIFTSNHFDRYNISKKKEALRDYIKLSNLTKKGGFNIHSNGSYISTLYNLFFEVIGLEIEEYFRSEETENGFTIILKKINSKKMTDEDLGYLYDELKHRNPIRYL